VKVEPEHVEKPLRKLRKMLNEFPADPRPQEVHSLRTQTRRLEAIIDALILDRSKEPRRLLKAITPVRKAAGQVRDMDVLIGDALTLSKDHGEDALVRLVQHLSRLRLKRARKLVETIRRQRKNARRHLKRSTRLVGKRLNQDPSGAIGGAAAPQLLITELSHWPQLDGGNLHSFRIRVKELRYMLQLSNASDDRCLHQLEEVKDAIGDWHDWMELLEIAKNLLDSGPDGKLLSRIEVIAKKKFQRALAAANSTRRRYFNLDGHDVTGHATPRKTASP
jgi:CHAD domain-containing protein